MSWASIDLSPFLPLPWLYALSGITVLVVLLGLAARANGAWLRALAAALLLLALYNPALVEEQREPLKDIAVVLVDDSPSVAIGDRRSQVAQALEALQDQLRTHSKTLETRILHMRHEKISDGGDGTKLIDPLVRALRDVPPQRVAGAILLTDGQVHDLPKVPETAGLPAPIHALIAGNPNESDRRLIVVRAPSFGIVGKQMTITVRIEDSGPKGSKDAGAGRARITLRKDGLPAGNRTVPVGVDHNLIFSLEHGGPTVFELAVAPVPDELTVQNNRAVVSVNGVRDRLRVLLVSGEPHAGERTWRNLLKSDPSVDLVHFTILRPPEKQDGTPINELSLISFPTRELFEVKLEEFDLVIFDRYRRRGVLPPIYLQNIVDYIENGGALLSAAGPTFASPFSIYRTALRKALPGEPTGGVVTRGFQPQISVTGLRHPVTAGLPAGPEQYSDGRPRWGRWFRQIEVARSRGRTLMKGIDDAPLLILDKVGDGRVAQFNSDHIWLWARGFEGGGPQAELLRRLAHWLMKEPELDEDALRASVRDGSLVVNRRSVDPIDPAVTVTDPAGKTRKLTLSEVSPGLYTGKLPVSMAGLYRVEGDEHVAMAAAGALNPLEMADVRASAESLMPVVKATGGSVRWLRDGLPSLRRVAARRSKAGRSWIGLVANEQYLVTGARRISVPPPFLLLILLLGSIAWAWRREGE
ncbi:MAG: hypothetical protein OEU46_06625 [Alphaproteobacteria bacterium]|nr:hypothetical protein [Alphaproteobacteria bacterium]